MVAILAATVGAIVASVVARLLVAGGDVKRHNRLVVEKDEDLAEWLIGRDRRLQNELDDARKRTLRDHPNYTQAVLDRLAATRTIALYEYREQLRAATAFRLRIDADERWTHAMIRKFRSSLPAITTAVEAGPLLRDWMRGTGSNALTWSFEDLLDEARCRLKEHPPNPYDR